MLPFFPTVPALPLPAGPAARVSTPPLFQNGGCEPPSRGRRSGGGGSRPGAASVPRCPSWERTRVRPCDAGVGAARRPQRGVLTARPVPASGRVDAAPALRGQEEAEARGGRKHVAPSWGRGAWGLRRVRRTGGGRCGDPWETESGPGGGEALFLSARAAGRAWLQTPALLRL